MKTVQINLYTIDELSDKAKERARDWWRNVMDFAWSDESKESIQAFCDHFGVTLKDWQIGPYYPLDYSTDAENKHFRGCKLSDFKPDYMPTGFYLDSCIWSFFFHEFKRTGDAKAAFFDALHEGFKCWRQDMEDQLSDDHIDETLEANGYTFTEDGKRFNAQEAKNGY